MSELDHYVLDTQAQAKNNDADALLALYIAASGNVRDITYFHRVNQNLDQWLQQHAKKISRQRKDSKKAEVLHQAMHEEFFLADDKGNTLGGYDADQSQLSEIFSTKVFNCISSSLLYIVLARKMDFVVEGVLLPSHAYVQMRDKNDEAIEIETTSIYGFDVVHNQEYYQNTDQQWFTDRNLEPTTYEDYLAREIVSNFELGLHNMWSQHTSPDRMEYQDRMRLAEMRSHLQADDVGAQKNRLNIYAMEMGFLNQKKDQSNLIFLTPVVENYLSKLHSRTWNDETVDILSFSLQTELALAKIFTGEKEQGFKLAKDLIEIGETKDLDQTLRNNVFLVLSHYLQTSLIENQSLPSNVLTTNLAQLRLSLIGLESGCVTNVSCGHTLGQLYAQWAQQFWDLEDWGTTSRILVEYLQFGIENENTAVFEKNAELAFINEAKQTLWDGDWESAVEILETCDNQLPKASGCNQQIKYINEQRHLGNI